MKRDPHLRGLSSEHHGALVLARSLSNAVAWSQHDADRLGERFDLELDPHFRIEEELLLPALVAAGATALVDRVRRDHALLRAQMSKARAGDGSAARAFGSHLAEHVRFEERELFPACEVLLTKAELEDVAVRAPHGR